MEPTQALIEDIYRHKVLRARRVPFQEKFMSGAVLYDQARVRMIEGIRAQLPDADEATVLRVLRERHARLRQVRQRR